MLTVAIIFIFLALIFYTVGVWSEKLQRQLKIWHVIIFWLGLICDTVGTTAMSIIAGETFQFTFHGISGMFAIILMLFHAAWSTLVIIKKDEKMKFVFHRFSFVVWIIWLIPMLSGMFMGITK